MQRVTQPLAGSARKGPRASNLNGVPSWPKRERERRRGERVGFERKKKGEEKKKKKKEKYGGKKQEEEKNRARRRRYETDKTLIALKKRIQ